MASTLKIATIGRIPASAHSGTMVVMNPDVGKSSTPKQTLLELAGIFVNVTFTFALSPTLRTIDDGLTIRLGAEFMSLVRLPALMGDTNAVRTRRNNANTMARER